MLFYLHTLTCWCFGPGAAGRALSFCIAKTYIWRQAFVCDCGAVRSSVSSDPPIINDPAKLWDRSETTGHSYRGGDTKLTSLYGA